MNISIDRHKMVLLVCFLAGFMVAGALNLAYVARAALVTGNQPMTPAFWNTNVTRINNLIPRYNEAMALYPGQLCGAASNSGSAPCVSGGVVYNPQTSCPSGFFRWEGNYPNGDFITCVKE